MPAIERTTTAIADARGIDVRWIAGASSSSPDEAIEPTTWSVSVFWDARLRMGCRRHALDGNVWSSCETAGCRTPRQSLARCFGRADVPIVREAKRGGAEDDHRERQRKIGGRMRIIRRPHDEIRGPSAPWIDPPDTFAARPARGRICRERSGDWKGESIEPSAQLR